MIIADDEAILNLQETLDREGLPRPLKERLLRDANGGAHYQRLIKFADLKARTPNSGYFGWKFSNFTCHEAILVPDGSVGRLSIDGVDYLLKPGYHSFPKCGVVLEQPLSLLSNNTAQVHGTCGFVIITQGRIGVLRVGPEYKLLAPGAYQWDSAAVFFEGVVSTSSDKSKLGPYSLITVPEGSVAITFHHGNLRILGFGAVADCELGKVARTYFLDDPNWTFRGFLSTQMQTDRLEGNDLLSKDNVELLMVAMSQWRIINPALAVTQCASTMEEISTKVDQLVRATIARIVAGTCIGSGPVSGSLANPVVTATPVVPIADDDDRDADLAHLMQSHMATKHMGELTHNMQKMGIEVVGVYVPEKRMKNDDTRREVAAQAVIGIKAEAERAAADAKAYATVKSAKADAEAQRHRADAQAYETVTVAKADAQAVQESSIAHAAAGQRLGGPQETAARLALTDMTARCLDGAKVTIFSGAPSHMPYMLTEPVNAA